MKISSIVLPSTVTEIGNYAFFDCKELKAIELNEGLKSIGVAAFECTSLENVNFPLSLQTISEGAFGYSKIKSVYINKNISTIDDNPFFGINCLENIDVDSENEVYTSKDKW